MGVITGTLREVGILLSLFGKQGSTKQEVLCARLPEAGQPCAVPGTPRPSTQSPSRLLLAPPGGPQRSSAGWNPPPSHRCRMGVRSGLATGFLTLAFSDVLPGPGAIES